MWSLGGGSGANGGMLGWGSGVGGSFSLSGVLSLPGQDLREAVEGVEICWEDLVVSGISIGAGI